MTIGLWIAPPAVVVIFMVITLTLMILKQRRQIHAQQVIVKRVVNECQSLAQTGGVDGIIEPPASPTNTGKCNTVRIQPWKQTEEETANAVGVNECLAEMGRWTTDANESQAGQLELASSLGVKKEHRKNMTERQMQHSATTRKIGPAPDGQWTMESLAKQWRGGNETIETDAYLQWAQEQEQENSQAKQQIGLDQRQLQISPDKVKVEHPFEEEHTRRDPRDMKIDINPEHSNDYGNDTLRPQPGPLYVEPIQVLPIGQHKENITVKTSLTTPKCISVPNATTYQDHSISVPNTTTDEGKQTSAQHATPEEEITTSAQNSTAVNNDQPTSASKNLIKTMLTAIKLVGCISLSFYLTYIPCVLVTFKVYSMVSIVDIELGRAPNYYYLMRIFYFFGLNLSGVINPFFQFYFNQPLKRTLYKCFRIRTNTNWETSSSTM